MDTSLRDRFSSHARCKKCRNVPLGHFIDFLIEFSFVMYRPLWLITPIILTPINFFFHLDCCSPKFYQRDDLSGFLVAYVCFALGTSNQRRRRSC